MTSIVKPAVRRHNDLDVARFVGLLLLVVALVSVAPAAYAEVRWERPVTLYIGAPPGGTFDIVARGIQPALEKELGVSVLPVNISGAGGGAAAVKLLNDRADGYQMLIISRSFSAMPYTGQPHVDPITRFIPLGVVVQDVSAVSVPVDSPIQTIEEFIAYAKEHPGEVRVGTSGRGGVWHMAGMLFARKVGIELEFIAYAGGAQAAAALAAKELEAATISPAEVKGLVDAGKIRVLAVMGDQRHPLFPEVPTLKERGIDVTYGVWRGFVVRDGTPPERVRDLESKIRAAASSESFRKAMNTAGVEIWYADAATFKKLLEEEDRLVAELLAELGLRSSEPKR